MTDLLVARLGLEENLAQELEVVACAERQAALAHCADTFELWSSR